MTIKMRLTLLFTMVVALLLAVLMWALYVYAGFQRSTEFTKHLFGRALTAATVVLESDEMSPHALEPFRRTLNNYQLTGESITIFDDRNMPVFKFGVHPLTITQPLRERTLGSHGLQFVTSNDTQTVYFPYEDNGKIYIVVASAIDVAGLHSLDRLRLSLIAGFAIAVTVTALIGWWFASRAMAPIAQIMGRAERISAQDLHIRLDEGNGKDELAHLARAFNRMLARLESAFHSQRQFIAHASHEIRTPLTTLEGQLEVALMKLRTELEYEATLRNALEDTRRLRTLSNDLLLLARAESELFQHPTTVHQFDEILFAAIEGLHRRYPRRVLDIRFPSSVENESVFRVRGNDDLLRAAVVNIIENALKYSDERTPVRITFEALDGTLRLSVTDQGRGIDPADLEKIFEPFFRGERTQDIPGTGIGLALVRTVIRHHGGTVTIESVPDAATTLTITLPTEVIAETAER
jgi:heavy metal sensor kinase